MSNWALKILEAEAERLVAAAADDPALRDALRSFARSLLERTEALAPASPEPLHELTLGRSPVRPLEVPRGHSEPTGSELALPMEEVERDCRQKAEALRWAVERQRRLAEGVSVVEADTPVQAELASWAETLINALYWSAEGTSASLDRLDDVAGGFEVAAESLALVREAGGSGLARVKGWDRLLPIVAEAQSALKAALHGFEADDSDQLKIFEWVRSTAARYRVFLPRYMRVEDRADPSRWSDRLARIDREFEKLARGSHARALGALDAALRQLADGDEGWPAVGAAVDAMLAEGVAPSDRRFRERLLPLIDGLPDRDDLGAGLVLVLRELDRYLATRTEPIATRPAAEASEDVKAVAHALEGRSVVLIGGLRHRQAQESLRRAFRLQELIWIATRVHQSIEPFEPVIAQREVALVLLAIRWSSHAFGDVKRFCDRHDKPLVRLPGGYSPNQVAAQIRGQVSGRLGVD